KLRFASWFEVSLPVLPIAPSAFAVASYRACASACAADCSAAEIAPALNSALASAISALSLFCAAPSGSICARKAAVRAARSSAALAASSKTPADSRADFDGPVPTPRTVLKPRCAWSAAAACLAAWARRCSRCVSRSAAAPAASIEVATPRNASCPALPTSSKARLTSALPSTPRRIETLVVDIARLRSRPRGAHSIGVRGIGADDDWLDLGEEFNQQRVERAHGVGEYQHRPEIERVDAAYSRAHLSGRELEHAPGGDAVRRCRRVLDVRAGRASGRTGGAIAVAPAEMPLGESDQAFFSASWIRAGPT